VGAGEGGGILEPPTGGPSGELAQGPLVGVDGGAGAVEGGEAVEEAPDVGGDAMVGGGWRCGASALGPAAHALEIPESWFSCHGRRHRRTGGGCQGWNVHHAPCSPLHAPRSMLPAPTRTTFLNGLNDMSVIWGAVWRSCHRKNPLFGFSGLAIVSGSSQGMAIILILAMNPPVPPEPSRPFRRSGVPAFRRSGVPGC